jgi:MFS family permease
MSTDQIFPLLASTSRELGGLALSAPQVGYIFTVVSILCICGQMAFPYVHRLLGNRGCLKLASICCIACCIISPNMVHLAYLIDGGEPELSTTLQQSGVLGMAMLCLMQQRLAGILGFPALVMLLTNAVPRVSEASGLQDNGKRIAGRSMLGTVNGLSQTINCASRGIGPLMMGPFWAWSLRSGRQWIFWAFVASLSACVRMLLFKVDDEEEHIETRP